ncbi:MAG: response regulator [Acidobacteriota bacterium]
MRVLLADDHAILRSGLRARLEKESDFEVVAETGDGFETVRAVADNDPDVLLLDLSMPGLPGAKVAESVLEHKPGLAILVLTMHEDEYYLRELFRIGARGFVLKKSSGRELIQAIRAVHRGERYVDPSLAGHVFSSILGGSHKKGEASRLGALSPREREVCTLLAYGHTNAEIADRLRISERTVESHRANIMAKLELRTRAELVRFAIDNGLLRLD